MRARRQHWTIALVQLLALGFTENTIRHRLRTGRLRRIWPGVYAVGARDLTPHGWWMGAVLTCGEGACLSHESAAQLYGMRSLRPGPIHVTVPRHRNPRKRKASRSTAATSGPAK